MARMTFVLGAVLALAHTARADGWTHYGGDAGGSRYSDAKQIDRGNVGHLREVWRYSTGEFDPHDRRTQSGAYEATPILVEGRLIFTSPFARVFALDPATGSELWRYDANLDVSHGYAEIANRGAASWIDEGALPQAPCRSRIFFGTLDGRLISLDSATGEPCADFGVDGAIDLKRDTRPTGDVGEYAITSPPVVVGDVVISGSAIGGNRAVEVELGIVRGFNARTGVEVWRWDPVPREIGDPAHAHWRSDQVRRTGAANAWAPFSVDEARGLVFVPTSAAAPDFYGGERLGDNRYANSLVVLRGSTGEVVWWRQLVHHDVWDYDVASQPTLVDLVRDGRNIPAVIQPTKMGLLFAFNRETGEPIFDIEERPVPQTDVPGEQTWPTQPFPLAPPSLVRNGPVTPDDAWGLTFWDRNRCRDLIRRYRSEGIYTPPSLGGSILFPGVLGGSNWGGIAFDPSRQIVIANVMEIPFVLTLAPQKTLSEWRRSGFHAESDFALQSGTPYGMRRELLGSPFGVPCTAPPWGSIVAVDMRTSEIIWRKPLGTTEGRALYAFNFGLVNLGGSLITGGGLVFIAATQDARFRAFDIDTGEVLWQTKLPAGGMATPMTYSIKGQQYVVIVAGGHARSESPLGDYVVAFALHGTGALAPPPNQSFYLSVVGFFVLMGALLMLIVWRRRR
jgi:quinoprotein glucose dehydrogenase